MDLQHCLCEPNSSCEGRILGTFGRIDRFVHLPWLLISDFKEILYSFEARGGVFVHNRAERFAAVLDCCNLLDIGAISSKFTWLRRCRRLKFIAKHLDRALGNIYWRHNFPKAFLANLNCLLLDHAPLLLRCGGVLEGRCEKPIYFQAT